MDPKSLLAKGLQQGFAGITNITRIERGGFELKSSHVVMNGELYHDEWVNGGGQELIRTTEGEMLTRTYVGNVIDSSKLQALGLAEKDIMTFLIKTILEHGEKTRFDTDFEIKVDNWEYSYNITFNSEDPFIINGIEQIFYKGSLVFVHTFGISKVVES